MACDAGGGTLPALGGPGIQVKVPADPGPCPEKKVFGRRVGRPGPGMFHCRKVRGRGAAPGATPSVRVKMQGRGLLAALNTGRSGKGFPQGIQQIQEKHPQGGACFGQVLDPRAQHIVQVRIGLFTGQRMVQQTKHPPDFLDPGPGWGWTEMERGAFESPHAAPSVGREKKECAFRTRWKPPATRIDRKFPPFAGQQMEIAGTLPQDKGSERCHHRDMLRRRRGIHRGSPNVRRKSTSA